MIRVLILLPVYAKQTNNGQTETSPRLLLRKIGARRSVYGCVSVVFLRLFHTDADIRGEYVQTFAGVRRVCRLIANSL